MSTHRDFDPLTIRLEDVIQTEQMLQRPMREPDFRAEAPVWAALARELAQRPSGVWQKVCELARELSPAESVGLCLLEPGEQVFRWRALSGPFAVNREVDVPRASCPSSVVVERDAPVLFVHPERVFPSPAAARYPLSEALLVPVHVAGRPVGALWAIMHSAQRQFDPQDLRLMTSLAYFAGGAAQVLESMQHAAGVRPPSARELELQAEVAVLRRQQTLSARLHAAADLPQALQEIVQAALELHAADMADIQLYDEARNALLVAQQSGLEDAADAAAVPRPAEPVPPLDLPAAVPGRSAGTARRWMHTTPLFARDGRPLGLISTHFYHPHRPGPRERQWLEQYAQQAAARIEQLRAHEALQHSEEGLRNALDSAQIGVWCWDPASDATRSDARTLRILGEPQQAALSYARNLAQRFHPDDQQRADAAMQAVLDPGGSGRYELELRYLRPDGELIWIALSGHMRFGGDGAQRRPLALMGTIIDVTQRKRAEEALREADRLKDEFIATLAHELRNPLAPISSGLHLLRRKRGPDSEEGATYAMMDRQLKQMIRLVDDLLEMSRITSGKVELEQRPVDISFVMLNAIETSKPLIEAGQHRLQLELPKAALSVQADVVRLAQVLSNLLNNAAKYTEPGGLIRMSAKRTGEVVEISVADNGIGIAANVLPRIFNMFAQGDRPNSRSQAGLGIGLTLARRLVQMHGGSIEARSAGAGHGSEFLVRLPLASESAEEVTAQALCSDNALEGMRVLVADDNQDAANSVGALMRALGASVRVVYSGAALLQALHQEVPDAALVDLGMPVMDGYEVARRIRQQLRGSGIVLIALTGWGQMQDIRRSKSAGFDHHLVKPVDIQELQALLVSLRPQL